MHLGIDLGTTNSAVAGSIGTDIRIFKTLDGTDVLPSVLYIDKGGHKLYGHRAYQQAMVSPENVAAGFKRLMGTSAPIEFAEAGQTLTAEECSAEILEHLVGQAFVESGESEVAGTVVTIPAAFNQMQSEATLRAARTAGLERVALLQEPIAAAMTSMAHNQARNDLFWSTTSAAAPSTSPSCTGASAPSASSPMRASTCWAGATSTGRSSTTWCGRG